MSHNLRRWEVRELFSDVQLTVVSVRVSSASWRFLSVREEDLDKVVSERDFGHDQYPTSVPRKVSDESLGRDETSYASYSHELLVETLTK